MIWDQTEWTFRADVTYVRVARDILESGEPFDLMALYIGGIDVAEHRFWQYAFPDQFVHPPDPKQIENFGRVIEDYYVWADRTIGEMLALVPKDASRRDRVGPWMARGQHGASLPEGRPLGIQKLRAPPQRASRGDHCLRRRLPLRARRGFPTENSTPKPYRGSRACWRCSPRFSQ